MYDFRPPLDDVPECIRKFNVEWVLGDAFYLITFEVADGPPVAVVSERFAEEAWPGEDPLGRTFHLGRSTDGPAIEVVGVVDDVKNQIVTEAPKPFVYFPITQRYNADIQLAVRTSADRDLALAGIRAALVAADPQMSRGPIVPLEEYTSLGLLPQRIAAGLTTGLALLALLLSAIGIYGVISFAVGAQRREIGIRLALGADGPAVVRGLVRRGLVMVGPGVVIGGALSIGVGHVVRGLLLDLSPYDPIALGAVGALLMTVVLLASWIPARGAAGVDPAESLREE